MKWRWQSDIPVLEGNYHFCKTYKGIELKETFKLSFDFPQNYPEAPPLVKEVENKIPMNFHHLDNHALCLCAPAEINLVFSKKPTLENYIHNLLNPYLVSWLWFKEYGEMPWGERSHGIRGIYESYSELLGIKDHAILFSFLGKIILGRMSQREMCPCGSNIPYRKCHKKIVQKLFIKIPITRIASDYSFMLQEETCKKYYH